MCVRESVCVLCVYAHLFLACIPRLESYANNLEILSTMRAFTHMYAGSLIQISIHPRTHLHEAEFPWRCCQHLRQPLRPLQEARAVFPRGTRTPGLDARCCCLENTQQCRQLWRLRIQSLLGACLQWRRHLRASPLECMPVAVSLSPMSVCEYLCCSTTACTTGCPQGQSSSANALAHTHTYTHTCAHIYTYHSTTPAPVQSFNVRVNAHILT